MNITLDAGDFSQLADFWKRAPDITRAHLKTAMTAVDIELVNTLKNDLPKGAGGSAGLQGSIFSEEIALGDNVIGMVASEKPYAAYVEFGTKPHPVSKEGVQSLADWVQAKFNEPEEKSLGIAHAIAWKIRRKGTPANPVWQRTWAAKQSMIRARFDQAMRAIARDLAGGSA